MKLRLLILALVTFGLSGSLFAAEGDGSGATEAGSANVNTCLDGSCNNQVNTTVLTENPEATANYVRRLTDDRHETPAVPGAPGITQ